MHEHDPRISALLRLKRHEQPPPGYFDRLLEEVHRRQRAELLRQPLWKIAVERVQVFFSEHSMGGLSYAGAMAVLVAGGVAVIGVITPAGVPQGGATVAAATPAPQPVVPQDRTRLVNNSVNRTLVLGGPHNVAEASLLRPDQPDPRSRIAAPRYIMDARPVVYNSGDRF